MTNRRGASGGPGAYVVAGFPHADFETDAPPAVWWAAQIAIALGHALVGRSIAGVARSAGIGRQTIYDVLRGRTWPDIVTIVQLQDVLDTVLWPAWPPRPFDTTTSSAGSDLHAVVALRRRTPDPALEIAG